MGIGGTSTSLGLFTLKEIPANMFVCAYAPMANLSANRQDGDYAMELTIGGQRISNNGQENAFDGDVSSVSPSSERIKELWVTRSFYSRVGATLLVVTWQREK